MCGVCLVGTSSPSANPISNSPLFVVMSFVSFLHSIVKFASLIKASCSNLLFKYSYLTQKPRSSDDET